MLDVRFKREENAVTMTIVKQNETGFRYSAIIDGVKYSLMSIHYPELMYNAVLLRGSASKFLNNRKATIRFIDITTAEKYLQACKKMIKLYNEGLLQGQTI